MKITENPQHDPLTEIPIVDAYFCWGMMAAEELIGKPGLHSVLRDAGLERLIDQRPSDDLIISGNYTVGDYTNYLVGLQEFFGRASKSMMLRIGKLSSKYAIEQQGSLYGVAALLGSKLLPVSTQIKLVLENVQSGFRKLYEPHGITFQMSVEDRGETWAYIVKECPFCAGKHSDEPMCHSWVGSIGESVHWMTGNHFQVVETECRAMGGSACVWEVGKKPV